MTIQAGTRLGHFEIVGSIGAGGMGEVWRARDTRLDRDVAVKILPQELANDAKLHLRFEREAKAISSLNHPNICTLHDVGHDDGRDFLVMELLDGESLAERLARGPLPLDEAIRYGIQIAAALETAHRQGVIHRDLKPGNVMITPSGAKLLDFGLARIADEANEQEHGLTDLPTQRRELTEEGTILGTVQYMAPEQLEGREADRRTDIFAFGMLLFEMVTGRKVFEGRSRVSLMAAILEHEPPSISSLQPITPSALDRLVKICLRKNPDDRWQTARDVELQLRWIEEGGSDAGLPAPVLAKRRSRERAAWVAAALAAVTAIVFAAMWLMTRTVEPPELSRFTIALPPGMTIDVDQGLAVSPDGSRIVFVGREGSNKPRLYVRDIGQLEPRPLSGTELGWLPFWSPDSREIAFFADDALKRVPASGGPPQTICQAPAGRGGTWGPDGTIVFSSGEDYGRGVLSSVSAKGGTPVPLTTLDESRSELSHRWPWFLPDGRHVLFLSQTGEGRREDDASRIEVLSLDSGERTVLFGGNTSIQYVPSGHILFWRDGSLLAQGFDPDRLQVLGEPVPIAERVGYSGLEKGSFSASDEGTLLYRASSEQTSQLTWFDRTGKRLETIGSPSTEIYSPALSWDGSRVAYELDGDLWVTDLDRGSSMRLTFDDGWEGPALWMPGDEWIVYGSSLGGIYRKRASGLGDAEILVDRSQEADAPYSSTTDGRFLYLHTSTRETQVDIARLDTVSGSLETLIKTPFIDVTPYPSPDGKWLAMASMESGRPEVYVHRLESPGGRWQISTDTGLHPTWSRDGKTIYYVSDNGEERLMAVEVETGDSFRAGTPVEMMRVPAMGNRSKPYDITADGSRVLWNAISDGATPSPDVTVVLNWEQMLSR